MTLTNRQKEIILYVAQGFTNPQIAKALELSTKTVENHVRNILKKLEVKNRTEAVIESLKKNLIDINEIREFEDGTTV